MKITERLNKLRSVSESYWTPQDSHITIYYPQELELTKVQSEVSAEIERANLWEAIDKVVFYSI